MGSNIERRWGLFSYFVDMKTHNKWQPTPEELRSHDAKLHKLCQAERNALRERLTQQWIELTVRQMEEWKASGYSEDLQELYEKFNVKTGWFWQYLESRSQGVCVWVGVWVCVLVCVDALTTLCLCACMCRGSEKMAIYHARGATVHYPTITRIADRNEPTASRTLAGIPCVRFPIVQHDFTCATDPRY